MKKDKISEIIDNINSKYIDEATLYPERTDEAPFYPRKKKLRFSVLKWGTAAAGLAVLIIGGVVVLPSVQRANTEVGEPESAASLTLPESSAVSASGSTPENSKPTDEKTAFNTSENSSTTSENTSTAPEISSSNTDNNSTVPVISESNSSSDNTKPVDNETSSSDTSNDTTDPDTSGSASEPVQTVDTGNMIPFSELVRPYADKTVTTEAIARLWQWELLTDFERYTDLELDGKKFYTRATEISEELLGSTLGSYRVSGTDWYTDKTYYQTYEVRQIKGISEGLRVAVKIGGKYYVFSNHEYDPPSALGELLDSYSLADTVELNRFYTYEGYTDTGYYALEDDSIIWQILSECRNAPFEEFDYWGRDEDNSISFAVTSEALGIYKNTLSVLDSGYLRTNIFDWGYEFNIGKDAANRIISYATGNAAEAAYEPYTYSIAGTLTEICDGYFLVDDSILCEDPSDGIVFKVPTDDLRIRRCVDPTYGEVRVGDLVRVEFTGDIDTIDSNRLTEICSVTEAHIYDGDVIVLE